MSKNKDKITYRRMASKTIQGLKILYKNSPHMVISTIVNSVWTALNPYIGIYMSALIITELSGNRDRDRLIMLVLVTLALAAAVALISAFLNKYKNTYGSGMANYNRGMGNYIKKQLNMDFADADNQKTKDTYSTIYQYNNSAGWGLVYLLSWIEDLIRGIFTIIGGVALTLTLFTTKVPAGSSLSFLNNPICIILVIVVMLGVTFLAPYFGNRASSYWSKHIGDHNLANRLFGFHGWLGSDEKYYLDVRMYNQHKMSEKYNCDKTETFASKGLFARFARGPMGAFAALGDGIMTMFSGFAYVYVCLKALGGAFGIGYVTQYVAAITSVSGGLSQTLVTLGQLKANTPFLEMSLEYLDIPHSMYKGSLTVEKRLDRDYEIEFRDVSFKYPGSDNYALRHVNVKFRVGERLAVVGENGSGKTTFILLLCRLYDPTEGEILLNGINITKYNYREYLDVFSVVFQDFKLPAFKLGEVVASSMTYDGDKATDCLVKTGFGDRLKELPSGLETTLYTEVDQNGVNVSGGEAQKIALARALYKDSPFIVLDEPTAALDPMAEAEIYSKFNDIVGDKTAIYISHRLSSCRFCDEIAVFDHGSIVQKGSHDELIEQTGKYSELWNAQAQYYTEEQQA
ncbi:MAG: ABC transporter ATP-binding protein/permease [Oscillospiraceae bacterium]|nr:ABC transporter ATP-binding protein/permease [Oscillospiraceae bacterium]